MKSLVIADQSKLSSVLDAVGIVGGRAQRAEATEREAARVETLGLRQGAADKKERRASSGCTRPPTEAVPPLWSVIRHAPLSTARPIP